MREIHLELVAFIEARYGVTMSPIVDFETETGLCDAVEAIVGSAAKVDSARLSLAAYEEGPGYL